MIGNYIDREALRDALYEADAITMKGVAILNNFPVADVRPVVHGEWIKLDMHKGIEQYKCSVCRSECYVPECMGDPMYAFCPNCGADCRGGNDGK